MEKPTGPASITGRIVNLPPVRNEIIVAGKLKEYEISQFYY
jgi:hypothetical protein